MDIERFDRLARTISTVLTRRALTGALALGALTLPSLTEAKKRKKKKVKFNDFNCVNVGGFCKNSGQCCSGICEGKKGKKKCKAHDATTCLPGQVGETCGGTNVLCTSSSGDLGQCFTTTGKAAYCEASGSCFSCEKDADCQEECGPQAACIPCADCDGFETACVGPSQDSCGDAP